jgi:hypothetical protein
MQNYTDIEQISSLISVIAPAMMTINCRIKLTFETYDNINNR